MGRPAGDCDQIHPSDRGADQGRRWRCYRPAPSTRRHGAGARTRSRIRSPAELLGTAVEAFMRLANLSRARMPICATLLSALKLACLGRIECLWRSAVPENILQLVITHITMRSNTARTPDTMSEFFSPYRHQFVQLRTCVPQVALTEPSKNGGQVLDLVTTGDKAGIAPSFSPNYASRPIRSTICCSRTRSWTRSPGRSIASFPPAANCCRSLSSVPRCWQETALQLQVS